METENDANEIIEACLAGLTDARFQLVTLIAALGNDYTDREQLLQIASNALAMIDVCITTEVTAQLAREELAKRALRGDFGADEIKIMDGLFSDPGSGSIN